MNALEPLWTDLTSWLAEHAPRTLTWLRPAGDPARLAAAEPELGFAPGAELADWWQLHDGVTAGEIVPGYELFGVDRMLRTVRLEREVDLEIGRAGGPAGSFPAGYVPIGDDGAGNLLVVDRRPGPEQGCLRDHDHEARGVIQPPLYAGLADLLTRVVRSLRTAEPLARRTPSVTDGMLSWELHLD